MEDHIGLWHGRALGSAINVEVFYDRWVENGVLKGVTTVVPFYIAYEEFTLNADGSLTATYPTILGYSEAVDTVSLPNEIRSEKTVRSIWSQANGFRNGETQATWVDPALNKTLSDAELTGRYHGELWHGISASERIEVTMDITIRGNEVRGEMTLPAETLEVIKGRRFNNRILLEVCGETIRGLMVGTASAGSIHFHWDMGVGYGQAEFQKTAGEPGEDGEP